MNIKTYILKLVAFFREKKKEKRASLFGPDYKQALIIKQGREQFKALMSKDLGVPVVFL